MVVNISALLCDIESRRALQNQSEETGKRKQHPALLITAISLVAGMVAHLVPGATEFPLAAILSPGDWPGLESASRAAGRIGTMVVPRDFAASVALAGLNLIMRSSVNEAPWHRTGSNELGATARRRNRRSWTSSSSSMWL